MNNHFDCNNCKDFMQMTCNGELCPNKSVQMRSIGGDKITMVTYEDQLKKLCKENDLNFLNFLTQIQDKLMEDMLVRGNNTPLFKKKVSSVLGQWKRAPEYEVLFSLPEEELSFDYSDLIKCNSSVLDLGHQMKGLEELISSNSERLYPRVMELQKDCREIDDSIKVCMGELDRVAEHYEPKYSRILLDLSTKPKSFYTHQDEGDEQLSRMVYHKNMREIPENIPEIFSNAVFVPNMITKETDYVREMLQNLKGNVRDKHLVLADLQGNIPERVQNVDPITRLFRYFVDSSDEEEYPHDSDDTSSVKPLTREQVSDIDALIEDVQGKKDDSVLKIEDKVKKVKEESKDKISGEELLDEDGGSDDEEEGGDPDGESSDEETGETGEKQLIDLAKQNGGGNYELSFF